MCSNVVVLLVCVCVCALKQFSCCVRACVRVRVRAFAEWLGFSVLSVSCSSLNGTLTSMRWVLGLVFVCLFVSVLVYACVLLVFHAVVSERSQKWVVSEESTKPYA